MRWSRTGCPDGPDKAVTLSSILRATTGLQTRNTNVKEHSNVDFAAKQTDTPEPLLGRGVTAAYLTFNQAGVGSNPSDPTAGA
jgi:hypothetical protein